MAILTAANLLGRMTPSLALDIPLGPDRRAVALGGRQPPRASAGRVVCGRPLRQVPVSLGAERRLPSSSGPRRCAYYRAWVGLERLLRSGPLPLPEDDTANPVGPALAVILAAAAAFENDLSAPPGDVLLNALTWRPAAIAADAAPLCAEPDLGSSWTVGTGSVGTAILYFVSLATREFTAALFDMDEVKVHNLDRSPAFTAAHVGLKKVAATAEYLNRAGVDDVLANPRPR